MDVKKGTILSAALAMIMAFSQNVIANDDEYLSLLEAEAETSRLDSGVSPDKSRVQHDFTADLENKNWPGECGFAENILPSNILREEFSSYLEQCSMTTFSLYRRLNSDLQYTLYTDYENSVSVKISTLRKKILKTY